MGNILIWPDISYEPGHWRPVISMAKKLQAQGHTVNFLVTPDCNKIIDPYNQEGIFTLTTIFPQLYPKGYYTLSFRRPEENRDKMDHLQELAQGYLGSVINPGDFDLLIAGYFISTEALIISHKHDIPAVITTTYLRKPDEDPGSFALRYLLSLPPELSTRLMNNADEDAETSYSGELESLRDFVEPLKQGNEIILCPEDIDHTGIIQREKTIYAEPSILIDPTDDNPPDTGDKIIYATAGSRVLDYIDSARFLFQTLVDIIYLPGMHDWKLRLAVGYDLSCEFENKPRVEIVNWSSQTNELQSADVAVIHGGLASIKECVYFNVPFVVTPLGKDQDDNAMRIREKKIGCVAKIERLNVAMMQNSMFKSMTDTKIIRKRNRMNEIFNNLESNPPSVSKLEEILS